MVYGIVLDYEEPSNTGRYKRIRDGVEEVLNKNGSFMKDCGVPRGFVNGKTNIYALPKGTAIFSYGLTGPKSRWRFQVELSSIDGDLQGLDEKILAVDPKIEKLGEA